MKNLELKLIVVPFAMGCLLMAAMSPSIAAEKKETVTEMTDIEGIDELRTVFEADTGSPRLILLLSPT